MNRADKTSFVSINYPPFCTYGIALKHEVILQGQSNLSIPHWMNQEIVLVKRKFDKIFHGQMMKSLRGQSTVIFLGF